MRSYSRLIKDQIPNCKEPLGMFQLVAILKDECFRKQGIYLEETIKE